MSTEISRVLSLSSVVSTPVDWSQICTAPGFTLRPVQERALAHVQQCQGGLFPIGVGHGKTVIALLSGAVLGVERAIVLVAPATVPHFEAELARLRKHFRIPETHIVSWGKLSQPTADEWFAQFDAQTRTCIVADEAHYVRSTASARTKRLGRWLKQRDDWPFVALSGTLTTRRLSDFAHLAARALREHSPVPRDRSWQTWDAVLAGEYTTPADWGVHCRPLIEWASLPFGKDFGTVRDSLTKAFALRLSTCAGVVTTQDSSCPSSLYLVQYRPSLRVENLWRKAEEVARTARDPDGVELFSEADVAIAARRLCFGYSYRWEWNGPVDREWLDARQAWARTCRRLLTYHSRAGFDSRLLVENEARRRHSLGSMENWVHDWAAWNAVSSRPAPDTVVSWDTTAVIEALLAKARQEGPCIIWYDDTPVADLLQQLGVRVIRAGGRMPYDGLEVALSIRAHGAGLNLQAWNRQVFACAPANGTRYEQVLGRTHRAGQQADEVWAWVPAWARPLSRALEAAREDAQWIEKVTQNSQKLNLACYLEER